MLTGAQLTNLSQQFFGNVGLGETLTLTINSSGRTETSSWSGGGATQISPDSSQSNKPAVIVSLSSAAKAAMSQQARGPSGDDIALALLGGKTYAPAVSQKTNTATSSTENTPASSTASAQATFGSQLGEAQQMSAADRFYATTDDAQAQLIATGMSDTQKAQFLAAFKAKTLTIQDASDVPWLNFSETNTAFGTATGRGESGTFSWASGLAGKIYQGNCFLSADPVLGGDLVSWTPPVSPTADTSASTPTSSS